MTWSNASGKVQIEPEDVAAAVAELISGGGLDDVTVNNVSEKLGVSRATLYRTIPDREQLFTVFFEFMMEGLAAASKAAVDAVPPGREQIRALVRVVVTRSMEGRGHESAFYRTQALPSLHYLELRERWESVWIGAVRGAMEQGVLARGDVRVVTKACMAMCLTTGYWWGQPADTDPSTIADEIVNLICPVQRDG